MGANAQTSVPAFTSGQVLTAAQVTQINTGIPVFATSTERDAAFGGAGEKTLAEGQMAYLEDTNETQYYDGSAWTALGASPGLVLLDATEFSAVSSVSVDNVFSSTYNNYLITFTTSAASANVELYMRLRVGGVDESSATNYYRNNRQFSYTTTNGSTGGNDTRWHVGGVASTWPDSCSFQTTIFNPAIAQMTTAYNVAHEANTGLTDVQSSNGMLHKLTTSYDGVTIFPASGTISGKLRSYGLADS